MPCREVRSYVVAPIMHEDRVLGFVYAIHFEVPLDRPGRALDLRRGLRVDRADDPPIQPGRTGQTFNDLVRAAGKQLKAMGGAGLKEAAQRTFPGNPPRPRHSRPSSARRWDLDLADTCRRSGA
jgi:hypothetical protein